MLPLALSFLALALHPDLLSAAKAAHGTVGVSVLHVETGHRLAVRGGEAFAMHSVFKLPIAIEVLSEVDAGKLTLDRKVELVAADRRLGMANGLADRVPTTLTVKELLEWMVVKSDNTACDKVLSLLGGPAVVGARMKALGVPDVIVDRTEKELAEGKLGDTATPDAMVALLEKLARGQLGLSKEGAALLDDLLVRTEPGKNRITAGLPAGIAIRHKTGTSDSVGKKALATNDVAVVTLPDGTHLAIAVFLKNGVGSDAVRAQSIAEMARAAYAWALADR